MRRREFIALIGGAATWPLTARAQQPDRMRRIGVLIPLAADDPEAKARLAAFAQGLRELGWTDGRNVRVDTRLSAGNADEISKYAAELVALAPDVILAAGGAVVGTLLQATRTVPIVFTQTPDPVGAGFVASLARPGGNATGFTLFEFGISVKWLELLREIAPRVTRAAVASGSHHILWARRVGRDPGRGAIIRSGGEPDRRARRAGDRARRHRIRAPAE